MSIESLRPVIAREWERGTMEAIMSTPATVNEIILGKLVPYFTLGLGATLVAAVIAVRVFEVPLRVIDAAEGVEQAYPGEYA